MVGLMVQLQDRKEEEMSMETEYDWLRDKNWPHSIDAKIIKHLETENGLVEQFFEPLGSHVDVLYGEMVGRVAENDWTVPIKKGEYEYYSVIKQGQEYWDLYRTRVVDGSKQLVLDENAKSVGHDFFKVRAVEISKNDKYVAYAVDYSGAERYDIIVQEISRGSIVDSAVTNAFPYVEWDNGSGGFYYIPADENWRAREVRYHMLNSDVKDDQSIYYEDDETFGVGIHKSLSERFLYIDSRSSNSNEIRYIDLDSVEKSLQLLSQRREDVEYQVSDWGDSFYIVTNDVGRNNRVIKVGIGNTFESGQELIPHSEEEYITGLHLYSNHAVLERRILGLAAISIHDVVDLKLMSKVEFEDESYDASHIPTEFHDNTVRYQYSSLSRPKMVKEWNPVSRECKVLKVTEIPSGFDSQLYQTKRLWVKSADGTDVPVSILYKKDLLKLDGSNPLYLYGYGSYGIGIPASFRSSIYSLVDRGFVFAIAHIRGGDDLGYKWYESAKFLNKKRTFEDFIASVRGLIAGGYTSPGRVVIYGASAGGMLIGYCINQAPELFKAAIMDVPFVDVLATMLDETLPLTPGEFKEWGNPKQKEFYDYIKSYSPFDNIKAMHYPHIFVTAGLYDPRVTYWEPAKFVSKLRSRKLDSNLLLFKTEMGAGHAGKSGRYQSYKEIAQEYAFILKVFGFYDQ